MWRAELLLIRLIFPTDPPGLAALSSTDRRRLNLRAMHQFAASPECLRMVLYLLLWTLLGLHLVWHCDGPGSAQSLPLATAWTWLWPWAAHARRRKVAELLRGAGGGAHVPS